MDHGHPLHLGVHVHRADTAEAAEALGLDLVVVPDAAAPRGSAPDDTSDDAGAGSGADVDDDTGTRTDLDAWTLLTYVAARTRTVHVSTTGLDLGARLPTVLARAAAGLDHLSDGRLALGLSAMGAPRRRPSDGWPGGQSDGVVADGTMPGGGVASGAAADSTAADSTVASAAVTGGGVAGGAVPNEALAGDAEVAASEEAITVLRGMWDAADPTPLRFVGAHHEVPGAPRGPAPAHAVPLWLSGAGAAGRALAARVADGWWLTVPGVLGGEAATGGAQDAVDLIATLRDERRALDAATTTAGRDPREVRLLVTLDASALRAVGTTAAIDLLTRAVVDAGAGTLVLADTSEDDTGWFASEVAAPLRAAVATERAARGTVVGTVRSAAVRAARQPHIDYDGIPAALRDDAVEPGDPGYAQVRSTYMRGGRPGLVLRPGGTAEVAQALTWARTQDVPLAIRSGGHGISGRSTNDGGIVLDLGRMNAIEVVDVARRRVRVQPGARWGEVAQALRPYGWAITSGDYGGVGVGGLATAGGIGFLVREHGLTIDHVRGVEVVLADGSVVRADEQENADLFWGVRGAGGNLGIVTSFDLEADEVGDVGFAQLVFDASDTADFLHRFGTLTEAAPPRPHALPDPRTAAGWPGRRAADGRGGLRRPGHHHRPVAAVRLAGTAAPAGRAGRALHRGGQPAGRRARR